MQKHERPFRGTGRKPKTAQEGKCCCDVEVEDITTLPVTESETTPLHSHPIDPSSPLTLNNRHEDLMNLLHYSENEAKTNHHHHHHPMKESPANPHPMDESSQATNPCLLKLFGEETLVSFALQTEVPAKEVLKNKIVLLYFSASTCGPCKQFTPVLEEMYRTLKSHKGDEEFEIVLCCGDTMPVPYDHYASKMPWWCLPFDSTALRRLSLEYKIMGFPSLVVVDSDGTLLNQDAVNQVLADTSGVYFPWRPRSLQNVLPAHYLRPDRTLAPISSLDDKYILLFAAGSWCTPCHQLLPLVSEVYRRLKAQRDDFELVLLSSDLDPGAFRESLNVLGCAAIPYEDDTARQEIAQVLSIRCIPNLLMFGPKPSNSKRDRPLLNASVRDMFWQCPDPDELVSAFPFLPKLFGDINQISDNINDTRCVVVFCEDCDDEEQEEVRTILEYASKAYDGCTPLRFFWACKSTTLTEALRESLRIGHPKGALMTLLDFSSDASYYLGRPSEVLSVQSVLQFVQSPGAVQKLR